MNPLDGGESWVAALPRFHTAATPAPPTPGSVWDESLFTASYPKVVRPGSEREEVLDGEVFAQERSLPGGHHASTDTRRSQLPIPPRTRRSWFLNLFRARDEHAPRRRPSARFSMPPIVSEALPAYVRQSSMRARKAQHTPVRERPIVVLSQPEPGHEAPSDAAGPEGDTSVQTVIDMEQARERCPVAEEAPDTDVYSHGAWSAADTAPFLASSSSAFTLNTAGAPTEPAASAAYGVAPQRASLLASASMPNGGLSLASSGTSPESLPSTSFDAAAQLTHGPSRTSSGTRASHGTGSSYVSQPPPPAAPAYAPALPYLSAPGVSWPTYPQDTSSHLEHQNARWTKPAKPPTHGASFNARGAPRTSAASDVAVAAKRTQRHWSMPTALAGALFTPSDAAAALAPPIGAAEGRAASPFLPARLTQPESMDLSQASAPSTSSASRAHVGGAFKWRTRGSVTARRTERPLPPLRPPPQASLPPTPDEVPDTGAAQALPWSRSTPHGTSVAYGFAV